MRSRVLATVVTALAAGVVLTTSTTDADSPPQGAAPRTSRVSVLGPSSVAPVAPGFIGLSMEYNTVAQVTGTATDQNVVLEQLIRNLDPGQTPIVRIGGDSTDHTWFPTAGVPGSPGLYFALTPGWFSSIAAFATSLNAQLILGINLEANRPKIASSEADALLSGIGASHIEAFEVGNEPDVYTALPWYSTSSGAVAGRPSSFGFDTYEQQLERVARVLPPLPLAGPAVGNPDWLAGLPLLLEAEPRLRVVTVHRYPLNRCFTPRSSPTYPTIHNLLSPAASTGLAASILPYAPLATEAGRQFRIDELNSVACSGQSGVSDTFASALWVLETLFAFARDGATGVNIHTFPTAAYRLFSFLNSAGQWSGTVNPEYYGLLMFAQAAPPGARLLQTVKHGDPSLQSWATATTSGATQVVLINDSAAHPAAVTLRAPVAATATVELLEAPSLSATGDVTLGGTSFATPTTTGELAQAPVVNSIVPRGGMYSVQVPAASAALVTVPPTDANFGSQVVTQH